MPGGAPKGNKNHLKHGGTKERLYYIWKTMRERCNTKTCKKYPIYGGRGILICEEWDDYASFRSWAHSHGYKGNLTIDRIDVNGNYEPSNCRWVTVAEQANNRRNTIFVVDDGVKISFADFCRKYSLKYKTEYQRYRRTNLLPFGAVCAS